MIPSCLPPFQPIETGETRHRDTLSSHNACVPRSAWLAQPQTAAPNRAASLATLFGRSNFKRSRIPFLGFRDSPSLAEFQLSFQVALSDVLLLCCLVSTPLLTKFISVATSDRRRGTVPMVWRELLEPCGLVPALMVWIMGPGYIGVGPGLRR